MSRKNSIIVGTFIALLLIALGIALAPFGRDSGAGESSPKPREGEVLASLPASGPASSDPGSTAREKTEGAAPGARESKRNGRVIVVEGGPVPPGTKVVVRLDNPDFMSTMSMGSLMRQSFQRGIAGQREFYLQIRRNRREGGSAPVAADGSFRIAPPEGVRFYLEVVSDTLFNDRWSAFRAGEQDLYIVRAQRGAALRGVVQTPDGQPAAGAEVRLMDHVLPGSGGKIRTPRDIFTISAADGSFVLPAVPTESLATVSARKKGFAAGSATVVLAAPRQSVTVALAPSSRVVGRVTDAAGTPVDRALISPLYGDMLTFGAEISRDPIYTNPDGAFEMDDLPPGRMRLRAEKSGYRPGQSGDWEVRPGAVFDAGFIILQNGTRIAGIVVNPENKPVEGAHVALTFSTQMSQLESGEGGATPSDVAEATTDAEGKFAIDGMGRGPYDLEATAPGYAPARKKRYKEEGKELILKLRKPGTIEGVARWPQAFPAPPSLTMLLEIATPVGPGFMLSETVRTETLIIGANASNAQFAFRFEDVAPGTYTILLLAPGFARWKQQGIDVKPSTPFRLEADLIPGVSVSGRVIDRATAKPLAGARVEVTGNLFDTFRSDLPSTVTKEDGTFELADLDAGPATIGAKFTKFAREVVALRGSPQPGDKITNVEIALGAGGAIEGSAFDDEGFPMAGGIASIQAPDRGEFEQLIVDRSGNFYREHLPAGTYQVSVIRGSVLSDITSNNPAEFLKGMKFTTAEVIDGQTTKLVLGARGGNFVKLRARLKSGNHPVPNALVTAIAQPRDPAAGQRSTPQFETTNAQGIFEMQVPAGRVLFTIQRFGSSQAGMEMAVEIPQVAQHEITLNLPMGGVEGTVRGPKGEALAGQPVLLSVEQGVAGSFIGSFGQMMTDDEGRYHFDNLGAGSYIISAGGASVLADTASTAWGRTAKRVQIPENDILRNVDFSLGASGSVQGTVTTAGKPLPGASIFFQTPDGIPLSRISDVFTNAGGQFKTRGIAAGPYRVLVRAPGLAAKFVNLTVEAGRDTQLDVELEGGAPAAVRVSDRDGNGITGYSVLLVDGEGRRMSGFAGVPDFARAFSDGPPPPGEMRLGTLAPGKYRITVSRAGFAPAAVDFTVSGSDPKTVEVRLQKE